MRNDTEKIRLIQPENTKTTKWSGGTTTQLTICPEGAVYADRDFIWRLSSAVVEDEESDFTPLPDYDRLIVMQGAPVELTHDGGPVIRLAPWQVHAFDGEAATRSKGKGLDFNLMLRKGAAAGSLRVTEGKAGEAVAAEVPAGCGQKPDAAAGSVKEPDARVEKTGSPVYAVYSSESDLEIEAAGDVLQLKKGGLALIPDPAGEISVRPAQDAHIITAVIRGR